MDIKKEMDLEIKNLSKYRSLIISRWFINVELFLFTFYLVMNMKSITTMIIILAFNISIMIIRDMLSSRLKKEKVIFSMLRKKYGYSKLDYVTQSIAYAWCIFLMVLWQITLSKVMPYDIYFLNYTPTFIILISLLIRIIGEIFYNIKIRLDLKGNKI